MRNPLKMERHVRLLRKMEEGTTQRWDYEPYGDPVAGVPPRKGFIDKEVDKESDLGDFGVRKYDDEIGRF